MKGFSAIAIGVLMGLIVAAPVTAGPPYTGTTTPLDPAQTGTTMNVQVSVTSETPVVPYEYAIQNECKLPDRTLVYQHDDIVSWTFVDGGAPSAIMPVYLQSVPAGANCKVFLVRNNTTVKGSTTWYSVIA
jgi:hypothetical protein